MSSPRKAEETYYDILKIDTRATISEIVAAYHSARNAFSKDSVATYSLFSPEEAGAILDRLEQAYLTLSNVDKKRDYDRQLQLKQESQETLAMAAQESQSAPPPDPAVAAAESVFATDLGDELLDAPRPETAAFASDLPAELPAEPGPSRDSVPASAEAPAPTIASEWTEGPLSGAHLREIREKRALSVDDVSRITKIPSKFIRAIESDDPRQLPARVYLQGFVKNLATLYRLDTKTAAQSYLQHIDALGTAPQG